MKKKLIGVAGKAGAGKDTFAKALCAHHGYARTAFAYPLKRAMSELFLVSMKRFNDRRTKEVVLSQHGLSPRQMMQIGADGLRHAFGDDLFIRLWEASVAEHLGKRPVIVSDVRTPAEVATIKRLGGTLVYIKRPHNQPIPLGADHPTEQFDERDADIVIVNDGTIGDLSDKARNLI